MNSSHADNTTHTRNSEREDGFTAAKTRCRIRSQRVAIAGALVEVVRPILKNRATN